MGGHLSNESVQDTCLATNGIPISRNILRMLVRFTIPCHGKAAYMTLCKLKDRRNIGIAVYNVYNILCTAH